MDSMNTDIKQHNSVNRIAINLETFDKYMPGKQKFFIQALTPTKDKNKEFVTFQSDLGNVINKDKGALNAKLPQVGSCIELEVPKDITRWFEVKFINPGTRFIASVDGSGPGKIKLVGRDFITEQGSYNKDERS